MCVSKGFKQQRKSGALKFHAPFDIYRSYTPTRMCSLEVWFNCGVEKTYEDETNKVFILLISVSNVEQYYRYYFFPIIEI